MDLKCNGVQAEEESGVIELGGRGEFVEGVVGGADDAGGSGMGEGLGGEVFRPESCGGVGGPGWRCEGGEAEMAGGGEYHSRIFRQSMRRVMSPWVRTTASPSSRT